MSCSDVNSADLRSLYWKPFSDALLKTTCVYYDNSPYSFGRYFVETLTLDSQTESTLISSALTFTDLNAPYWRIQTGGNAFYELNDPIIVSFPYGTVTATSVFPFPVVETNGRCNYDRPAVFSLTNTSVTCNVIVDTTSCFRALNYTRMSTISFYTSPSMQQSVSLSTQYYDYDSGASINSGYTYSCPSQNVVMSVSWIIAWSVCRRRIQFMWTKRTWTLQAWVPWSNWRTWPVQPLSSKPSP